LQSQELFLRFLEALKSTKSKLNCPFNPIHIFLKIDTRKLCIWYAFFPEFQLVIVLNLQNQYIFSMVKDLAFLVWKTIIILLVLFWLAPGMFYLRAQSISSFGIANPTSIKDKIVRDGDIVSASDGGYTLTRSSYDPRLYGVVTINPAVAFNTNESGKRYPVVSSGNTYVNLSTINGKIKKGDPITSSPIPGVGMKATESGYILGYVLEDFSSDDAREIKRVKVQVDTQFFAPLSAVLFFSPIPPSQKRGLLDDDRAGRNPGDAQNLKAETPRGVCR
jgi:hypothetical protein